MRDPDVLALTEAELLALLGRQLEHLQSSPQQLRPADEPAAFSPSDADQRRYLAVGAEAAKRWLDDVHVGLQLALCDDGQPREELRQLEGNAKDLLKLVAGAIVPLLSTNLPAAGVTAVTGIATTLGLIVIKRRLERFCALPPQQDEGGSALPVITG